MALVTETYCLSSKRKCHYLSPLQGQTPWRLSESSPLVFSQAGLLIFGVLLLSSGSQTKSFLCVSLCIHFHT